MTTYRTLVGPGGGAQELARIARAGAYQIGGTLEPVRWELGAAPSAASPVVVAGAVATVHLERDAQLYVQADASAAASSPVAAWLVWPDE